MKKLLLTGIFSLFICTGVFGAVKSDMKIMLDGNEVEISVPIVISDNRSFVPLREMGDKILHANVSWDEKTRTAKLTRGDMTVAVQPDSDKLVINDLYTVDIDSEGTKAFIEKGYTYLPIRALCEAFDCDVDFKDNTIFIEENVTLPQFSYMHKGDTVAVLHTNYGDISLRFFPDYAPKATENFITHAKEGYYDGVTFHRVIDNFVIQGGDPEGTGMGGESIWGTPFENEVSMDLRHFRGALCMANSGEVSSDFEQKVNSNVQSVQLYPDYIVKKYNEVGGYPYIDFGYTVFGQVIDGMEVVDNIAAVSTDENDRPVDDVVIENVEVYELNEIK